MTVAAPALQSARRAVVAAGPSRRERPALLTAVVPTVSLAASAGMATSAVALLPALAAAGGFAALAALAGRRGARAHLAVEPLGMAFMLVLAGLHSHGQTAPEPAESHAHGPGWVLPLLTLTVAVLSAICLVSAVRDVVRLRIRRPRALAGLRGGKARWSTATALLSCVSAAAMCAMTAHMLLG